MSILAHHLQPTLWSLFPGVHPLFKDDKTSVHIVRYVQTGLDEHNDQVKHLMWRPQSPDLIIIEEYFRE